ncbi:MAG: hypothetical protein ACO32I_07740, partial [Candidatus Limnocylindrus sp.]
MAAQNHVQKRGRPLRTERHRQKKELVLLQLALALLSGGSLSYRRLTDEFLLERRTAERYLRDLKEAGLPIVTRREGRQASFVLDELRSKNVRLEAVDIPPAAARPLSLLLVASALLPARLGVREAVDSTVRAALRLRGLRASSELRRLEDAVLVLENDAKDYGGRAETFRVIVDACLAGELEYRSPRMSIASRERFWVASVGLYRGGLYALAVADTDDGSSPVWRAVERMDAVSSCGDAVPRLDPGHRQRALDEASRRWGPARPRVEGGDGEQII